MCCLNSFSQISIDNTTYSPNQLIDGVLVAPFSGTTVSNVTFRGVNGLGNKYQLGYFSTATTTLTQMGFANGVVLTTGKTSDIPSPLGTSPATVLMDEFFIDCMAGLLQEIGPCPTLINDVSILTGVQPYFNATILEFDFTIIFSKT